MDFVHLHVHSHYSLLDGLNRMEGLVKRAKELGMNSLALTDHGNLHGAVDFQQAAAKHGVKPIAGMEAYISPTTRADRSMGNPSDAAYHVTLLVMDKDGWRNLLKLSSRAYLEGFYYKPRVDRELLGSFNAGLIGLSGCLGGEIPSALLSGDFKKAQRITAEYRDIFGCDRFFLEVMNHNDPEQMRIIPDLVRLAREFKLGLVGTNDCHFLLREDKRAHELLTCIATGKLLDAADGLRYSPELYLKSPAEMSAALAEWPEAVRNTLKINEMCQFKLEFGAKYRPVFKTPNNEDPDAYIAKLAWEGLPRRFADGQVPEEYRARLTWELSVIQQKGYSSYFLIVNDFVQYARRNNIPAAPRGSGIATLLGYALGIADVDPMRYGLLFERFTDPQRKEDPDMDIDMCQEGRAKVIQYVRDQYGHVAQIITYGTLKARAVLRDVGRVMNIPLPEVDMLAKKIPEDPKMTLGLALEAEAELRALVETNPRYAELFDLAAKLEGLARHAGVHAAGVVVCDQSLENCVPLCTQKDADVITQWDGPTCEKAGLMKMDFLGLRTLTILQRARELVRATTGKDVDPEKISFDDPQVFGLFQRGETEGVFQFESAGMQGVLRQMQPTCIEDLIAANAMYRPGPLELIPEYCRRKKGEAKTEAIHPLVDPLLKETYGIMIYQEQVMQVLNLLGKLPLNRALTMIKAVSKKKPEQFRAERPAFLAGAEANRIEPKKAEELFALLERFADYGFNKAHSTRYAIIAYQTAYFKVHHTREFFAATLTFECTDRDKVVQYMAEGDRMGVKIAAPDINTSDKDFTVDGDLVRFGLLAVKGVGAGAVDAICEGRRRVGRFQDLFHFCQNVDLRAVNNTAVKALIKCGAFDALGNHRAAMLAGLDSAMLSAQTAARDRAAGQMNLFDAGAAGIVREETRKFPEVARWSQEELMAAEKETLGFYITAHPLARYRVELEGLNWPEGFTLAVAGNGKAEGRVGVGCMVTSVRTQALKRGPSTGKKMAIFALEDPQGQFEGVMFPEAYEKHAALLREDALLYVVGSIDRSRERVSLIVDSVFPLEEAAERMTRVVSISVRAAEERDTVFAAVQQALADHKGSCPVQIRFQSAPDDAWIVMDIDRGWHVKPGRALAQALQGLPSQVHARLVPKPLKPVVNNRNGFARKRSDD